MTHRSESMRLIQSTTHDYENTKLRPLKICVIPKWIHDRVRVNNNLVDIQSYRKLRQSLSLIDLAHLEIVENSLLKKVFSKYSQGTYNDTLYTIDSLTEDERLEYESSVLSLAASASEQESVFSRLEEQTVPSYDTSGPYEVVVDVSTVLIIVSDGFIEHMGEVSNRHAFLSQVLKSAYSVSPIHEVNRSSLYRLYLDTLAAQ